MNKILIIVLKYRHWQIFSYNPKFSINKFISHTSYKYSIHLVFKVIIVWHLRKNYWWKRVLHNQCSPKVFVARLGWFRRSSSPRKTVFQWSINTCPSHTSWSKTNTCVGWYDKKNLIHYYGGLYLTLLLLMMLWVLRLQDQYR